MNIFSPLMLRWIHSTFIYASSLFFCYNFWNFLNVIASWKSDYNRSSRWFIAKLESGLEGAQFCLFFMLCPLFTLLVRFFFSVVKWIIYCRMMDATFCHTLTWRVNMWQSSCVLEWVLVYRNPIKNPQSIWYPSPFEKKQDPNPTYCIYSIFLKIS